MQAIGFWTAAIVTFFVVIGFIWAVISVIAFFIRLITGGDMADAFMAQYVVAGFLQFVTFLMWLLTIVFTPLGFVVAIIIGVIGQILGC